MTPVKLVAGDSAPDIVFTLTDALTELLLDLTTLDSAEFRFRQLNTTVLLASLLPTVLGAPTNGQLTMAWGTTLANLPLVPGFYEGQLKLTFLSGKLLSGYNPIQFYVEPSF